MRTIAGPKEEFGRIMYGIGYLMWVIQAGEPWCMVISPKECCHNYRLILHYSHQLGRWRNKNLDAYICVVHACGNRPKRRLSL